MNSAPEEEEVVDKTEVIEEPSVTYNQSICTVKDP